MHVKIYGMAWAIALAYPLPATTPLATRGDDGAFNADLHELSAVCVVPRVYHQLLYEEIGRIVVHRTDSAETFISFVCRQTTRHQLHDFS